MWPRRITQERSLSLRKDFLGKKRVSNILSHYDGLMVLFVRIAGVQRLGELWLCGQCRKQVSIIAGTVFQDTHLPIQTWFRAMWHICSQKNGMSALGLQRVLGLGSYRSAWLMLHKLRRAMVRPHRERLQGIVEVDETYLGAAETGVTTGRQIVSKALLVIAAEVSGKGIGRIRM